MAARGISWLVPGTMIASMAYVIEIGAFPIILPQLAQAIGRAPDDALFLASIYNIALIIFVASSGVLSDRVSRELFFKLGFGIFLSASALMVFASSDGLLALCRIFQGIGAGLFSPMVPAILSAANPQRSVRTLSIWGFLTGMAAAFAPFVIAALSENFGYQLGWAVIPAIGMLAMPVFLVRTPKIARPRRIPFPRQKEFWAVMIYVFLNYGLTTWFMYSIVLRLREITGTMHLAGLVLVLMWVAFAAVNLIIARVPDTMRLSNYLVFGAATTSLACLLTFQLDSLTAMFGAAALIGVGMAFNNAPTTELAFRFTSAHCKGRVASLDIMAARAGGAVLVLLAAADYALVSLVVLLSFVFSIATVIIVREEEPKGLPV